MCSIKDSIQIILESICNLSVKTDWRFQNMHRWIYDYAIVDLKILIDFKGGGAMQRGYLNDMEKYNAAAMAGWTVLRYAPFQTDKMIEEVRDFVKGGGKK